MQGTLINVLFAVVLFCTRLSTTEEDRFFWSGNFVSKPNNFYHGAAIQIPVIEGEQVEIDCKVRAVSEDPYTIIWDYENFHANTTGKTVLKNNTAGDEFAVDTIEVDIDNPADIDDKDIICSWENGKFSDTISLQFKVYVVEDEKNSSGPCCEGVDYVRLVRPGQQRKEDANMEEMIKEKAKKHYEEKGFTEVNIEADGSVCCCKPSLPGEKTGRQEESESHPRSEPRIERGEIQKVRFQKISEAAVNPNAAVSTLGSLNTSATRNMLGARTKLETLLLQRRAEIVWG